MSSFLRFSALPAFLPSQSERHYRWTVLAIGVAAQASFAAAFSGLPVTGVLMRNAYQMTTTQLGLVLGCMALGVTFSEVFWGLVTDKYGDRKVLLTGLLSTGLALFGLGVFEVPQGVHAPSYLHLCMGLVLVGLLGGSVNSSSGRAIMGWFNDGQRGLAMSIRQTAVPAGGAIGAALLPMLAQPWGFRAVFFALAALCVFSALLTWLWLHEPTASAPFRSNHGAASVDPSPLYRMDVWRLAIACGLLTAPQISVLAFGGVFLQDMKSASLPLIAGVIVMVQVTGSIARIVIGQRSDRGADRRALLRSIGLLAASATACTALFANANAYCTAMLLCLSGLTASAWHGVAYTEIAIMAGPMRAGTALGIMGMTIFASAFLTPVLIPFILSSTSWPITWGVIAAAALLAVPIAPKSLSPR
ncbi:MFS transporter [Aquabacterium sp. NJ1]|uniref:MFS transporter n=1 Tax=Aquabacterium sp. NJ1 TaxID=1538295 RepID=UPI00068F245D|nr:MFS transporter [Aquabacterium sp. NJ1]